MIEEAVNIDNQCQLQDFAITTLFFASPKSGKFAVAFLPLKVGIGQVVEDNFVLNTEQFVGPRTEVNIQFFLMEGSLSTLYYSRSLFIFSGH
jgi:hypothetical protein